MSSLCGRQASRACRAWRLTEVAAHKRSNDCAELRSALLFDSLAAKLGKSLERFAAAKHLRRTAASNRGMHTAAGRGSTPDHDVGICHKARLHTGDRSRVAANPTPTAGLLGRLLRILAYLHLSGNRDSVVRSGRQHRWGLRSRVFCDDDDSRHPHAAQQMSAMREDLCREVVLGKPVDAELPALSSRDGWYAGTRRQVVDPRHRACEWLDVARTRLRATASDTGSVVLIPAAPPSLTVGTFLCQFRAVSVRFAAVGKLSDAWFVDIVGEGRHGLS